MNLNLTVQTNVKDVVIDYIQVKLLDGKEIDLDWDFSYMDSDENANYYTLVGLNANGESIRNISLFEGAEILDMALYSEQHDFSDCDFVVKYMHFHDGKKELTLAFPYSFHGKNDYKG